MSENQNRGVRDFSMYDSMSTEELEEILRLDCEADDGQESDTELLFYVMGVLAERRKNSNTQEITAQQAWESFQSNYLPESEEASAQVPKKTIKFSGPWLRRMVAAAAVIAILVCVPVVASAFGWEDIWNAVATWAKETFSFVTGDRTDNSEPAKDDSLKYTSLQQALAETEQNCNIVPTWIPDGYELKSITIEESPKQKKYIAFYQNGGTSLSIFVQAHLVADPQLIEVGESPIDVLESSGIEYYIFANMDKMQIIWYVDSYECYVSCELTMEEIKMMIDSVGKG